MPRAISHFLSNYLYADLILNNQFKTRLPRLPLNLLLEYEDNLNASDHPFDYSFSEQLHPRLRCDRHL